MSPRFDMGRIHDGFYTALFHSDPEKGALYSQIVDTLESLEPEDPKPILLSGTSPPFPLHRRACYIATSMRTETMEPLLH